MKNEEINISNLKQTYCFLFFTLIFSLLTLNANPQNNSIFKGGDQDGFAMNNLSGNIGLPIELLYFKADCFDLRASWVTWRIAFS